MKLPPLKITLFLAILFAFSFADSTYAALIPNSCKQIFSGENCEPGYILSGGCTDPTTVQAMADYCVTQTDPLGNPKVLNCNTTPYNAASASASCSLTGSCPEGSARDSAGACTNCASGWTGYDHDGDPATASICVKKSILIYDNDSAVEEFKGLNTATNLWEAFAGLWSDDGTGNISYSAGNVFLEAPFFQDAKLILDNSNIEGVNALQFNDRGSGEGIKWGGTNARIDVTEYASGGGSGMWVDVEPGGGGTAGTDGTEGEWLHLKGGFTGISLDAPLTYVSGNVGIGTTSPTAKLEVATPVSGTVIKVGRVSGNPSIEASGDAAGDWLIADGGNGIGNVGLNYYSSGDVILANGGGKVGIGTMSPVGKLEVKSASGNLNVVFNAAAANSNAILKFYEGSTQQAALIVRGSGIAGGPANALNIYTYVDGAPITLGTHDGEVMRIADGGKVGIGITNPRANLHVYQDVDGTVPIYAGNANTGSSASTGFFVSKTAPSGAGVWGGLWGFNASKELRLVNFEEAGFLSFSVGSWPTEKMRIDTDGNVGIGTTSPADKLHVAGDIRIDSGNELFFADNGQIRSKDNNHRLLFRRAENILELREYGDIIFSSGATSGSATNKMIVKSSGNVGIGTTSPNSRLHVNSSSGENPFRVQVDGSTKLFLDSNGNLAVGGYFTPVEDLHVKGKIRTDGISAVTGGLGVYLYQNTLWYRTSSAKYKENIQLLKDDFYKILNVEPKTYIGKVRNVQEIGYIAEEFDELELNHLVNYDKNGNPIAIKYDQIPLYIIEVVKEQQKMIEELQTKVEALETER